MGSDVPASASLNDGRGARMRKSPLRGLRRPTHQIEEERQARIRLAEARRERQAHLAATMAVHKDAIRAYRAERKRALEQGKPVLATIEEWRGGR